MAIIDAVNCCHSFETRVCFYYLVYKGCITSCFSALSMLHASISAILCMSLGCSKGVPSKQCLLRLAIGLLLPINPPARGTMMSSRAKGQDQQLSECKKFKQWGSVRFRMSTYFNILQHTSKGSCGYLFACQRGAVLA